MLVDLNELRESGTPLQVRAEFTEQELRVRNPISVLDEPVYSELKVSVSGDQVRVSGQVRTDLQITCCRCLKPFHQRVEKVFNLEYWPQPRTEAEGEEIALSYPDLEIGFYNNDQLDLTAVVSEQIVLEIPMKPVCMESCQGLCDQCGTNLNEGKCQCRRDHLDPRLAVLAEIKKRLGS